MVMYMVTFFMDMFLLTYMDNLYTWGLIENESEKKKDKKS